MPASKAFSFRIAWLWRLAVAAIAAAAPGLCPLVLAAADAVPRPNMVVVLVDDLRWDDLACTGHPLAKTPHVDRLAREGATFRNAFATTPLCSPSRASFLTGLYAHTHGIVDNTARVAQSMELPTFPRSLQAAGYETAFVGKWHMGNDASPRPGFDHWVCLLGQGTCHDPQLNQDGQLVSTQGYVTDLLNERAVEFVTRQRTRPFLLYLAHKAVHPDVQQQDDGSVPDLISRAFVPAPRHRDLYADAPVPRRPNAGRPPRGKPALERRIGDLPPLGPGTATSDEDVRNRLRMLASIDEGVGLLLAALERTDQLDNTCLVFTSDHGYFYGEHGLSVERRLAYEESARIPLLVRYPPLVGAESTIDALTLSVDLAPTLLELGGAAPARPLHGRSLVPLLRGEQVDWRESILIEYFTDTVFPRVLNMGYQAVRTAHHKYIRYAQLEGMDELYDLARDPYEMENLSGRPEAGELVEQLRGELTRLLEATP